MADNTDIETTDDTGLSEEVETSLEDEVNLEDIEINIDELQDDDAEPETEETEDEAATEPDETEETEEAEPDSDDESTDSDNKIVEQHEPTEAERKRQNDEYAKRRIAEKQLREERAQREQENLQRYLDEAGDDEFERERRTLEVEKHLIAKERTDLMTQSIEIGLDKAVASIDLFQKGTPEQLNALDKAYQNYLQMHVRYDQAGNVLAVDKDVTTYLTEEAESIRQLSGVGARQQERDKKIVRSRTDTLPVRKAKEAKTDPYLDAFLEEAKRY